MGELWQQAMNKTTELMGKNMKDKEKTESRVDQRTWWGEMFREERDNLAELHATADCLK